MPVKLYRRHRKECEAGHPEDFTSGEFEEGRRGWKRCGCIIHASGTIRSKFNRKQTGKVDWEEAKAVVDRWQESGSWDGQHSDPIAQFDVSSKPDDRIRIEHAIKTYLAEREEAVGKNTYRKARYILKSVQDFSNTKGYVFLDQWMPVDIRELRASWKVAGNTGIKYMDTVRAFFDFCVSNKCLEESAAGSVKNPKGKGTEGKERIPFTDEELTRMLNACEQQYGNSPSNGTGMYTIDRREP